jgi:hypothetical protein
MVRPGAFSFICKYLTKRTLVPMQASGHFKVCTRLDRQTRDETCKLQRTRDVTELEFSLDAFVIEGKGNRGEARGLGLGLDAVGRYCAPCTATNTNVCIQR